MFISFLLQNLAGGKEKLAHLTGSRAYERFTINQIIKFARDEPEAYANTEAISLVSSFVACLLTGVHVGIDAADASGMNCMDIHKKDWVPIVNQQLCLYSYSHKGVEIPHSGMLRLYEITSLHSDTLKS